MTTTNNINTNLTVIVLRTKLLELMNVLQIGISGDSISLPILKNVLVKATDGKLFLTTTNLEVAVHGFVSGKVTHEGELTIPFGVFYSIIKNLSSERVALTQKDLKLSIATDNYEASILGQSAYDFPSIPTIKNESSSAQMQTGLLKDSLQSVVTAVQFSDIRPEISGVFVCEYDKQIIFVGTDSFRLAEKKIFGDDSVKFRGNISLIIPLKTVNSVIRVLGDSDEIIDLDFDQHQISIKTPAYTFTARLVDGVFPDYKQIIPKDFAHEVTVDREELSNAVKLASSLSGKTNDVVLRVQDNKKVIEVFSSDSSVGEGVYKIPAKVDGSVFSIIFNWRYLLDGLKMYKGKEIVFGVNNFDKPASIKSPSEPFLNYIVMPIKG